MNLIKKTLFVIYISMEFVKPEVIGSSEIMKWQVQNKIATYKRGQIKEFCRKLPTSRIWICEDAPFFAWNEGWLGLHKVYLYFVSTERQRELQKGTRREEWKAIDLFLSWYIKTKKKKKVQKEKVEEISDPILFSNSNCIYNLFLLSKQSFLQMGILCTCCGLPKKFNLFPPPPFFPIK